jgi:hypothetical protein
VFEQRRKNNMFHEMYFWKRILRENSKNSYAVTASERKAARQRQRYNWREVQHCDAAVGWQLDA